MADAEAVQQVLSFSDLKTSTLGIWLAFFAQMAINGAVYAKPVCGARWMAGLKKEGHHLFSLSEERMAEAMGRKPIVPGLLVTLTCVFVKAYFLALLLSACNEYSVVGACKLAFLTWLGFTMTSWHHYFWAYRAFIVGVVDMGFELLGALAMATVLAVVGV